MTEIINFRSPSAFSNEQCYIFICKQLPIIFITYTKNVSFKYGRIKYDIKK